LEASVNILAFTNLKGKVATDLFEVKGQTIKPVQPYFTCLPGDLADQLQELWENGARGHVLLICPNYDIILRYDLLDAGLLEHGCIIEEVSYEPDQDSKESIRNNSTSGNRVSTWCQETTATPSGT
jgi:hypothetical protein